MRLLFRRTVKSGAVLSIDNLSHDACKASIKYSRYKPKSEFQAIKAVLNIRRYPGSVSIGKLEQIGDNYACLGVSTENSYGGGIDGLAILEKKGNDWTVISDGKRNDGTCREAIESHTITKVTKASEPKASEPPEMLTRGMVAYTAGDFPKAREAFGKFLAQHPKNKLAPSAHYWLAESYYNEKNYDQAILEYQEVIKNSTDKEKVPAALLKQGMAFKESGDSKSSVYVLKKLIEEYPKSDEARQAKEQLYLR